MTRLAGIAGFAFGLLAASQAPAVERLSGDQIRRLFEGNTVSGRYSGSNLLFSDCLLYTSRCV